MDTTKMSKEEREEVDRAVNEQITELDESAHATKLKIGRTAEEEC